MAVDDDTKKCLDDVKKGKPRRFVMICKGAKILSVIVYKKGSLEKFKKQAKEDGNGQVYHGVVSGKGVDVTFNLLRSDGFEKPPGKDLTLKEFLSAEADMKFKPTYAIVDVLPEVDESDDDSVAAVSTNASAASSTEVASTQETLHTPSDAAADLFKARLTGLVPRIKQAAGTPAGENAKLKASEAGVFARKNDYPQANALLDQAEQYLRQAASNPSESSPSGEANPAELFKVRLAAVVPQIKQLLGTPAGEAAKLKVSEASTLSRNQNFTQANVLLDEVEQLLKQPRPQSADSLAATGQPAVDWEAAKASWRLASDNIDSQITQLQRVLKTTGDGELVEIAEFGLNALTGNYKVPLMAAIRDIDAGSLGGRAKSARKAMGILSAFRQHIDSSNEVAAVDNNPFGVQLSIRSSLSKAFTDMEYALQNMIAE